MPWFVNWPMGSTWDSWLPVSCNQGPCTSWTFAKARGNGPGHHHPVSVLGSAGTDACNKTVVPCGDHGASKTVWHFCFWSLVKSLPVKLQGYHRRRWRPASGWSCHLESRVTFPWLGCSAPWLCFWVICQNPARNPTRTGRSAMCCDSSLSALSCCGRCSSLNVLARCVVLLQGWGNSEVLGKLWLVLACFLSCWTLLKLRDSLKISDLERSEVWVVRGLSCDWLLGKEGKRTCCLKFPDSFLANSETGNLG